jgi:GNAT superfamily N-acetyltransferase
MLHEAPLPSVRRVGVVEVEYDAVEHLRTAWHGEYADGIDESGFRAQAREVAMRRGARVLAVPGEAGPVAFAELISHGDSAEITQVYVHSRHRGAGLGASLTAAAVDLAGRPRDLWICADDQDRPKVLYARLGFGDAWRSMMFERAAGAA